LLKENIRVSEEEKEKIRKLVEFKTKLEKRVEKAEAELEDLRVLMELVNRVLMEKSFQRAKIAKPVAVSPPTEKTEVKEDVSVVPPKEFENVIPLKMVTGEPLAEIYVGEGFMEILPSEEQDFNVNTPPFTEFLVERVLNKMQEKDREKAKKGQITPEEIFSYDVIRDGNFVRKIVFKNVSLPRRRELKSSVRWTLEKMYEKTKA
jgi:hypothetical protein